jgi:hypothetical protein
VTTAATARADLSDAALARVTRALAANAGRYDRTAEFPAGRRRAHRGRPPHPRRPPLIRPAGLRPAAPRA